MLGEWNTSPHYTARMPLLQVRTKGLLAAACAQARDLPPSQWDTEQWNQVASAVRAAMLCHAAVQTLVDAGSKVTELYSFTVRILDENAVMKGHSVGTGKLVTSRSTKIRLKREEFEGGSVTWSLSIERPNDDAWIAIAASIGGLLTEQLSIGPDRFEPALPSPIRRCSAGDPLLEDGTLADSCKRKKHSVPDWPTDAPQQEVREFLCVFARRFLRAFGQSIKSTSVFFLEPAGDSAVASGLHGYRYAWDAAQFSDLLRMLQEAPPRNAVVSANPDHVRTDNQPCCTRVFETAAAQKKNVLAAIKAGSLTAWERRLFTEIGVIDGSKSGIILELPFYQGALIPPAGHPHVDGPSLIACIALPVEEQIASGGQVEEHIASEEQAVLCEVVYRRAARLRTAAAGSGTEFVGVSANAKYVVELAKMVAPWDLPVLVLGDTGVGKDVVAKLIHELSGRDPGRFRAINCAALPPTLLESELFGHIKGAYTGATSDRDGLFRSSDGGTLFLDEIGDMDLKAQAALLRVLETKRYRRVGADKDEPEVDVRVIAATNKKLEEAIRAGGFREDLYWRLAGLVIDIDPLRKRPEDIMPLAEHFLRRLSVERGRPLSFSAEWERFLTDEASEFPGNGRALRRLIEIAVALGGHNDAVPLPHERVTRQFRRPRANQGSE